MTASDTVEPKSSGNRKALWARGAYGILFLIAVEIARAVLAFSAVIQFVLTMINGKPNGFIVNFGRSLSIWLAATSAFLTFATEDKPFPFAPWPSPD